MQRQGIKIGGKASWTMLTLLSIISLLFGAPTIAIAGTTQPVAVATSLGGNDYPWANYNGPGSNAKTYTWTNPVGKQYSPLGFSYRNCTDYVAYEINEQLGGNTTSNIKFSWSKFGFPLGKGNAVDWKTYAAGKWPVNSIPAVGAVAWWGKKVAKGYGHVAIVASVANSSIVVDDYNNAGTGKYSSHIVTKKSAWPEAFIHIADVKSASAAPYSWTGLSSYQRLAWNSLTYRQPMAKGQYIVSDNEQYALVLQTDGNLVVYHGSSAIWNSKTAGSSASKLVVQSDGNLVLYTSSGKAVWNSGTNGNAPAIALLQSDGNFVIYVVDGPAEWSSKANGKLR